MPDDYPRAKLYRQDLVSPDFVGKYFVFEVEVIGESNWFAVPKEFSLVCRVCGETYETTLEDVLSEEDNLVTISLAGLRFNDVLKIVETIANIELTNSGATCTRPRGHLFQTTVRGYTGYKVFRVRDIIDPEEMHSGYVEMDLYAFGDVANQYMGRGKYRVVATPVPDIKSKTLVLLAKHMERIEDTWSAYKPSEEDLEAFEKYFSFDTYEEMKKKIDETIATDIVGVPLAKLAMAVVLHSALIISRPDGKRIRGWLRAMFYGDTRCGKGSIIRDVTLGMKIGVRMSGETSSRTGLLYSIDPESKLLIWGELVLNDGGFLGIEGFHGLTKREVMEFREALASGVLRVDRRVKGQALARTRIVGDINPNKPMKNYMYRCEAIPDTPAVREPPDVTRWDIWVPFWLEQVDPNLIAEASVKERAIPADVFRRHVLYAWGVEDVVYEDGVEELVREYTKHLLSRYVSVLIPIINNESKDTFIRIMVAMANLDNSIYEVGGRRIVRVTKKHFEFAKRFIEDIISINQYDVYSVFERRQRLISVEELEELVSTMLPAEKTIILSCAESPKRQDDLRVLTGLEQKELKEVLANLRIKNLLRSGGNRGYMLTPRGVELAKYLIEHGETLEQAAGSERSQLGDDDGEDDIAEIPSPDELMSFVQD